MATLNKLMICGIRNFGPQESETQFITFKPPLTLLLGENGCGKTSILECLKFACTGELPSGCKNGHGFINDPKLTLKAAVKGQVRLDLIDANGRKFLIVKSVQIQQTLTACQFKRLDFTLKQYIGNGTYKTMSTRCNDIDNNICEILGVSKAILNNVIFCHQEDSLWPLDEPKKLKEKFDEIFGASAYNKSADNIRKIIKDKENEIKVLAVKVDVYKQKKEYVDKTHSELNEKTEKLKTLEEQIDETQNNIVPIQKRLVEISELENNLGKLQAKVTKLEATKEGIIEQQNTILKNLGVEFEGSDAELQDKIRTFDEDCGTIEEKIKEIELKKRKNDKKQQDLSKSVAKAQIAIGKLLNEKKAQEGTIKERNQIIETVLHKLNLDIPSLDSDNISNALELIKTEIQKSEAAVEQLSKTCEKEETDLQKLIDANRDNLSQTNHTINSKNQQILEIKSKIRTINTQLKELNYSDERIGTFREKIGKIDNDLKALTSSLDVHATTTEVNESKQRILQNEDKLLTLEREHKILLKNNITEAELENQRHEIAKKESEISKLENKHYDDFNLIFEENHPVPGVIKQSLQTIKETNWKSLSHYNSDLALKQNQVVTVATQLSNQRDKLINTENELKECRNKIYEICQDKTYETECSEVNAAIEKLQKDKGQYRSAKIMYEKFVNDFEKQQPCCPVCMTGFNNNKKAVPEIISRLRSKIQGIPLQLSKVEEELNSKQSLYHNLLQLKPVYERINNLHSGRFDLQSEIENMNTNLCQITEELNDTKEKLIKPQRLVDTCNTIMGNAALIDQYQIDIRSAQRKISELELQMIEVSSKRSRQQTEIEISKTKSETVDLRRNCEKLEQNLRNYNDTYQEYREERNKLVEKQLEVQKLIQGKPQLQENLIELTEKEQSLLSEIDNLKVQLTPLKANLAEAEQSKKNIKITNKNKITQAQNNTYSLKSKFNDVTGLQKKIADYVSKGVDKSYEATLMDLSSLNGELKLIEEHNKEILKEITELNKRLSAQREFKRTLTDNSNLREKRKEEKKINLKMQDVKNEIGSHDYRTILLEKRKITEREDQLKQIVNSSLGKQEQLKEEIKKLQNELNLVENKQSHHNYKKGVVEHIVNKKAVVDLRIYLKALEHAILRFHKERMDQLNNVIRYLWRSIYRGNDCDYIEIETDESKTTGLRKTYNYKVVQRKSTAVIDMRGRCSAGQKVLASLVIRMALAETFSKNCGILALDEPTTNLDKANIESLSDALCKLVNSRQLNKNFQLIVITHDEEFIQSLSKIEGISYYWKVSRNSMGNSVISKINEL